MKLEINSERWLSLENLEGENWRDIQGYEGLYQVSNLGRVKSLDRVIHYKADEHYSVSFDKQVKGKIIRQCCSNGYMILDLCKNGKIKNKTVHRLVATTFIENPNNHPVINHKDKCRSNNRVDNLEWCTQKYNNEYSNTQEKASSSRKMSIWQFDKSFNFIKEYESAADAERELGYSHISISECCRGEAKSYKGYIWKIKGEYPSKTTRKIRKDAVKVSMLSKDGDVIAIFDSTTLATKATGRSHKYIYKMANTGKVGRDGYKWKINKLHG
jgi:hypothetical protein